MVAMFPLPPISATNRPPGLSARRTEAATAWAGDIQWSAALENTASIGASRAKSSPLATLNRRCGYASLGPGDHRLGSIDPDDLGARLRDLRRQVSGPAAEVKNL